MTPQQNLHRSTPLLGLLLVLVATAAVPATSSHSTTSSTGTTKKKTRTMNDGIYEIANGNPSGASGSSRRRYATDYPRAEFFDVYSPLISTRYGQVFWTQMAPVDLPADIVARFHHKTMAVVGYEVDQVRRIPTVRENGTAAWQDVSVPITHAYNHHYIASLHNSRQGSMKSRPVPESLQHHAMTHGTDELWDYVPHHPESATSNDDGILHAQVFSEANGGEMRLSYHGYPQGFAQLVYAPNTWSIQPMQIDTYNRDAPGPQFVPGPLPKIAPLYNQSSDDVSYSGLLECPCSTAIEKKWWYHYQLLEQGRQDCPHEEQRIENATECFQAGAYVIPAPQVRRYNVTGNVTVPYGCSVVQRAAKDGDGVLEITWNARKDAPSAPRPVVAATEEPRQVMAYATGVIQVTVTLTASSTTNVQQNGVAGVATIQLEGPADAWFGIGFDTQTMCRRTMEGDECPADGPYAILVYDDKVEERALDFHGMGRVLPEDDSSWNFTVMSNNVTEDGKHRVVVLERPLEGPNDDYFSFDINESDLPIIMATGCNMTLAQHCGHGASQLNFLTTNTPMSVCRDGVQATIGGKKFNEGSRCASFPTSTLLEQENPTCSVHTYQGGLHCCRHMQSLLDTDQETPWSDQPLEYHIKFRYYFEEYTPATTTKRAVEKSDDKQVTTTTPASHQNLVRMYWQTESYAGEYDIVQCPAGTPPSQCIQIISSRWPVKDMIARCDGPWCGGKDVYQADGVELIYAGPHCHAPSCISMELYNADTGELLCRVEPRPGNSTDKVFDEMGFLAIPPCLWGHEDGLMKPVFLSMDTTLLSIKRNNNTRAHFGEMASWQMRGVVVMKHTLHDGEKAQEGSGRDPVATDKERGSIWNNMVRTHENSDAVADATEPQRTAVRKGKPVM